jgi:hypothetical protein
MAGVALVPAFLGRGTAPVANHVRLAIGGDHRDQGLVHGVAAGFARARGFMGLEQFGELARRAGWVVTEHWDGRSTTSSAWRRHRERPHRLLFDLGERHFFVMAIVMFGFGLLFRLVGVLFALGGDPQGRVALPVIAHFAGYDAVRAVAYRRAVNVWPAAVV